MPKIFSIGHSTTPIERFIAILKRHKITHLADARTTPFSKYAPQYNRFSLEKSLESSGISYIYRGKSIGGLGGNKNFDETIDVLANMAKSGVSVAVMCSEGRHQDCHRFTILTPQFEASACRSSTCCRMERQKRTDPQSKKSSLVIERLRVRLSGRTHVIKREIGVRSLDPQQRKIMAMEFKKVFLGDTPSDQRKYLTAVLRFLKDKYPKIVLPAVGQFTLAKCAIEAGYARENISCSDISLYTSLLGYLYARKSVESLAPTLAEEYRERYGACADDIERAAYLIWLMKTRQLKTSVLYERLIFDDLIQRRETHVKRIAEKLRKYQSYYDGINYEIADMRVVLGASQSPDTLVVVNPPVFRDGYRKMFDFKGAIVWDSGVAEFDFEKEYRGLYERTKTMPTPYIWYRWRSVEGIDPREVIFCKEYDIDKRDYWLVTKPDVLAGFRYRYTVDFMVATGVKPHPAAIFTDGSELTENSKISFVSVSEQVALYYRDLFAHKLGNTAAEQYFLMLVDGKIFATVGFMTTALFRLESDRVFENYGFNAPVKGMARANRLLMMAITSKEFAGVIRRHASRVNRIYRLNGLRTTCLSKYRKVKLNNGILDVESCERIREGKPNGGMYKIVYDTSFHDLTFAEVVRKFLDEEKALSTSKAVAA